MSYRALARGTRRQRAGDVRDVVKVGATVAGALSNPVDAVASFIGGQLFNAWFGESAQDRSIRLFYERLKQGNAALQARMRKNPLKEYLRIYRTVRNAKRNPKLRFR